MLTSWVRSNKYEMASNLLYWSLAFQESLLSQNISPFLQSSFLQNLLLIELGKLVNTETYLQKHISHAEGHPLGHLPLRQSYTEFIPYIQSSANRWTMNFTRNHKLPSQAIHFNRRCFWYIQASKMTGIYAAKTALTYNAMQLSLLILFCKATRVE